MVKCRTNSSEMLVRVQFQKCLGYFTVQTAIIFLWQTLSRRFESCLTLQQHASVVQLIEQESEKMDRVMES